MEAKITNVKGSIDRVKEGLRNNRIEADDLNILLKLKDVPDDLHEVIVLIHTYNKHNVSMMRSENELVMVDITNIMEKLLDMTELVNKDVKNGKKKFFTAANVPYILAGTSGMFFLIWLAYLFDPEATKYVMGLVGDTFSSIKKYILSSIIKL